MNQKPFFLSKKVRMTLITMALNALIVFLKIQYPKFDGVWAELALISNTLAGVGYVASEASIDVASVKQPGSDLRSVTNNTNVEGSK